MIFIVLQSRNSIKGHYSIRLFSATAASPPPAHQKRALEAEPGPGTVEESRNQTRHGQQHVFHTESASKIVEQSPKRPINKSDKRTDCERLSWFANNRDCKCNMLYSRRYLYAAAGLWKVTVNQCKSQSWIKLYQTPKSVQSPIYTIMMNSIP